MDQALPFFGIMTRVCTGMRFAGCLEVPGAKREPAWPVCPVSCFPASRCWERTGAALGTVLLFWQQDSGEETFGTLFSQNNCSLRWKDTGALGSIHIFHKCVRDLHLFSGFLKSRKTRCFHLKKNSTRDRNFWLRIQGLNPKKTCLMKQCNRSGQGFHFFSQLTPEVCRIQKGLQSVR